MLNSVTEFKQQINTAFGDLKQENKHKTKKTQRQAYHYAKSPSLDSHLEEFPQKIL